MTGPHRLVRPVYVRKNRGLPRPHVHTEHVRAPGYGAVVQCCCGTWVTGAVARRWDAETLPVPIGGWPALLSYAAAWLFRTVVFGALDALFQVGPGDPPPYRGMRELRARQKLVRDAVRAEREHPTVTRRPDPRERWWCKW